MRISESDILRISGDLVWKTIYDLIDIFAGTENFDELVAKEWGRRKIPVYIPGRGLSLNRDISDGYLAVNALRYNEFKNMALKLRIEHKWGKFSSFIRDFLKASKSSDNPANNSNKLKEIEEGNYPESLVFIPYESIFHSYYDNLTLWNLKKTRELNTVLRFLERLANRELSSPLQFDWDKLIDTFANKYFPSLSRLQREAIVNAASYLYSAIEGGPGAGKTTTIVRLILFLAEVYLQKQENYVVVLTANTYAAVAEPLVKIIELARDEKTKKLLRKLKLNIIVFGSDRFPKVDKQNLENLDKARILSFSFIKGRAQQDKEDDFYPDPLPGLNLIVAPVSKFRTYQTWTKGRGTIRLVLPYKADLLVIDESSQMSGLGLIEVIAGVRPEPNTRIVITGDRSQLPPIYSSLSGTAVPFNVIGPLYNVFTLLKGRYHLTQLKETKRLPKSITELIKPSYNFDIISTKQEKNPKKKIRVPELGIDSLLSHQILRIEVKYPKEFQNFRKSNKIEVEIAEAILRALLKEDWGDERPIAVLTPFKEQEELLSKHWKNRGDSNRVTIGTVDRMQGREAIATIVSFSVSSPAYAKEILPFVFNPNRLNVAFTRSKESLIVIHSEALANAVYLAFDTESLERKDEILIGYKRFNQDIDEEVLRNFPEANVQKGYATFRRLLERTEGNIVSEIKDFPESGVVVRIMEFKSAD